MIGKMQNKNSFMFHCIDIDDVPSNYKPREGFCKHSVEIWWFRFSLVL